MVIAKDRNLEMSRISDLFKYLKKIKTYRNMVLNMKCEIHFPLQLLFTTFFCLINT
jgi:hypothetical protein